MVTRECGVGRCDYAFVENGTTTTARVIRIEQRLRNIKAGTAGNIDGSRTTIRGVFGEGGTADCCCVSVLINGSPLETGMVIQELGISNIKLSDTDNRTTQEISMVVLEDDLIQACISLRVDGTTIISITID